MAEGAVKVLEWGLEMDAVANNACQWLASYGVGGMVLSDTLLEIEDALDGVVLDIVEEAVVDLDSLCRVEVALATACSVDLVLDIEFVETIRTFELCAFGDRRPGDSYRADKRTVAWEPVLIMVVLLPRPLAFEMPCRPEFGRRELKQLKEKN